MIISHLREVEKRLDSSFWCGGTMKLEMRIEQPIPRGWLAYCARARDVEREKPIECADRNEEKRKLIEGRSLANRD